LIAAVFVMIYSFSLEFVYLFSPCYIPSTFAPVSIACQFQDWRSRVLR